MLTVDDSLLIAMAEAISSTYDLFMLALVVVIVNSIIQAVTAIIRTMRPKSTAGDIAKEILNAPLPPVKPVSDEDIYKQYQWNDTPEREKAIPTIQEDRP